MTVAFLDLGRQVAALRPELDEILRTVLDEGRFVGGAPVEEFERAFAAYCGADHAVGVSSGTDAISIALQAVGVEPGDEVVTAANTCVPTVAAIEAVGATPVLVDPDEATFTLGANRVESVLTERTTAIVPVHLYGRCADMTPLVSLARRHGLKVVEDAAQAHGAEHRGARAGALGDAAAFSFYPTKNLGALGDGGAVVTRDASVAERARLLRSYGEERRYHSVMRGGNSRLDTLQAAVLVRKLAHLEDWNERRRTLALFYREAFADMPVLLPGEGEAERHVYHLFVIRVAERDAFRAALAADGVETLVHYPRPVHDHPAYRQLARGRALEVSERLSREIVSLPLYPELGDGEAEQVVRSARSALTFVLSGS